MVVRMFYKKVVVTTGEKDLYLTLPPNSFFSHLICVLLCDKL